MTKLLRINNKLMLNSNNKLIGVVDYVPPPDPYNPLGLPASTIRAKFSSGYTPTMGDSQTLVDSDTNVWDIVKSGSIYHLFQNNSNLLEVLGANTEGITDITYAFEGASSLTTVALFDVSHYTSMRATFAATALTSIPQFNTGNIQDFQWTFNNIIGHTTIPLLDVHSCTNCNYMFWSAYYVEGGALDLYNAFAALGSQVTNHSQTFYRCGYNTTTGSAELSQIPSGWK